MHIKKLRVQGSQLLTIGPRHQLKDTHPLGRKPNHDAAPVRGVPSTGHQAPFHRPVDQQRGTVVAEL